MLSRLRGGFTLIELLIVVAIIAILAAIAVPNFLEAQTRSKVSRVRNDLRALTTAIEAYRVDLNDYPEGTDNPDRYPVQFAEILGPLAGGYYTFATRVGTQQMVGRDFANITTPVAYMSSIPTDPFSNGGGGPLTYCYRNAKATKNGWILTSVGPDVDLMAPDGRGNTNTANLFSTAADTKSPARLGDINEVMFISFVEGAPRAPATTADIPRMRDFLVDLSYDATNGTISDGDLWRVGP